MAIGRLGLTARRSLIRDEGVDSDFFPHLWQCFGFVLGTKKSEWGLVEWGFVASMQNTGEGEVPEKIEETAYSKLNVE